ncbi:MAG: class III extradiol ring-cleavage dioxygenase [Thermodesulfobacteriota bacterium]|nr:class III extradiol ring-cleavage dioxygenase [Thermodesulfobacteriota bacterium]
MIPSLFVSHGMPAIVIQPGQTHHFLRKMGSLFERPRAVICASAHWEAVRPMVTGTSEPETIHDFSGPSVLFDKKYPVAGHPELAKEVVGMLNHAGLDARIDPSRGLDHGAWVPLMLMYPDANIPVVQLSIQTELDPGHHLALGRALGPLRKDGVLILGSGGATHNLSEIHRYKADALPPEYAVAFDGWLEQAITQGDEDALIHYKAKAPSALQNHPYPAEHFLPLFVPMGAGGPNGRGRVLHKAFMYGVLSMAAFAWE